VLFADGASVTKHGNSMMETAMRTLAVLLLGAALSACGSGNEPTPNAPAHEHPTGHVLGQFDLGDGWFMQASHEGSIRAGAEIDFEVVVKKDGEPAADAKVRIYAADGDGKPLMEKTAANWQAGKKLYTARVKLPDELPGGTSMTFEADADGKSFKKSVSVTGHQHD
jgi:hypothetical protein